MADEVAAHHLLTVLEERDLAVCLDDVLLAFESDETREESTAWVCEYLDPSTLLSRDELELYSQLSANGRFQSLQSEDSRFLSHRDEDLEAAVAFLQTSTAAIEEHIKVLNFQKDALEDLKALNKPNLAVEHIRNDRRRREHQEKSRLEIAIEDLSSSISSNLATATSEAKTEHAALLSYATERLSSDDRMLAVLPKIASNIAAQPPASNDTKAIDQWCKAIVSFRAAEIKARVDATYQLNLAKSATSELPDGAEGDLQAEKSALQEELESLHSEIAAMAEMVVEHELREPIVKTREIAEEQRRQAQRAWLAYVLSTLQFMTFRLSTMTAHAVDLSGFLAALHSIDSVFSSEVAAPVTSTQPTASKRQSMALKSLLSPPVKLRSTAPLDLPLVVRDVLRHTSIPTTRGETVETILASLMTASAERQAKLDAHHASAGLSMSRQLGEVLETSEKEAQALRDAVYVNTLYKSVSFTDQALDVRLKALGMKLGKIEEGVGNAEGDELSQGENKVATFVEKWGQAQ